MKSFYGNRIVYQQSFSKYYLLVFCFVTLILKDCTRPSTSNQVSNVKTMPIMMSKEEWERIVKWADPNKEDPAAVRRREQLQYMDKMSQEMTKSWPNSLENVNKRNEELRRARQEASENANTQFYNRYVRRKQEEQQRLMHSARDTVFKNKDAPKLLLSAVIETAVQKELEVQREFNKMMRDKAAEKKRQEDDRVIQQAKDWHELHAEKQRRRREENKKHQKEILEQAHEVAERNRIEYETELNAQKVDNAMANKEIKLLKKYDEKLKADEKKRIFQSMEEAKAEFQAQKRETEARDKMDDRLIEVLIKSKCRVEQMRKNTEKRLKSEKLRILEAISNNLKTGDDDRNAKEQANHDKAVKQKEMVDLKREKMDADKKARLITERMEQHKQFLKEEEQRLHEMNTMKKWQMLNRFKNGEIYEEYIQRQHDEKQRKIQEYRKEILRLWKERDDREAHERAETREFYGRLAEAKLRDADNKLLAHADHLVQEAVAHGRPPYAIYKAIERYCKMYRLYPMPELYKSMQEHFKTYAPVDSSRPDPWYKEPPPPPEEDRSQWELDLDEEERKLKRDGLQQIKGASKPKPSASPPVPAKQKANHRLVGPSNGLQQRPAEIEYVLPPITAIPVQLIQPTPYIEVEPKLCSCGDQPDIGPKDKGPKDQCPKEKGPEKKGKS